MADPAYTAQPLHTPELLELILSFLPPHALLLAQRTCKTWHNLITASPTLQTALFLRASASQSPDASYTLNPLLKSAFPFILSPKELERAQQAPDWDVLWGDVDVPAQEEATVKPFVYSQLNRRRDAFKRKEASWRRMHLCDPPVRTVVWRHEGYGMAGHVVTECVTGFGAEAARRAGSWMKRDGEDVRLEQEEGLRMGVLYDYLFASACGGGMLVAWDVEFGVGGYPGLEEVVKHAQRDGDLSLARLMRDQEEGGGDGDGRGVTLLVKQQYSGSCVFEMGEEFPQFMSEGYCTVGLAPKETVLHNMWD
ncbi:hypothetical protein DPSP01_003650 [Paraphaeosphaeria sporulosa]|uniref:F-box domain-containing protein n=1 Tax=Paraphaeosphaeria sporulosa TaxID=1460663 RepID=A0A177BYU4_9PLEO|nr:uncharacterized protein CC84DRAFT_407517 [Paraphaeosphaeria sporulosa]OAF99509.1 hypothetical protein CC84DRAFT_407517 [Paraphaeosphaeria sporulosa]